MTRLCMRWAFVCVLVIGSLLSSAGASYGAGELLDEGWSSLSDWTVAAKGQTIEIDPAEQLRLVNSGTGVSSLHRSDISIPARYSISWQLSVSQTGAANQDAIGLRVRNGDYKLEVKFRNNGIYVVQSGTPQFIQLASDIGAGQRSYRAHVDNGQAEIFMDNLSLGTITLPVDTLSSITYIWSGGSTVGGTVEAYLDDLRIWMDAGEITGFSIPGQLKPAFIDHGNRSIVVEMPVEADLTALTPMIAVSSGAAISPASGTPRSFEDTVKYTITNQGVSDDWFVHVIRQGQEAQTKSLFQLFDRLPAYSYVQGVGNTSLRYAYTPGETEWTAYQLEPQRVFQAELQHDQGSNDSRSWNIRIGEGGQIYSLRTSAGELIPPQEHKGAEWIDEVFQLVAVNTVSNNRDPIAYPARTFIHQAGTYWLKKYAGVEQELDPGYLNQSYYSPMLADYYDPEEKAYYSLVWGQYSHVPNFLKSGALIYTKYKDLGDGVIEYSYVLYNDGEEKLNWFNVPWGGVRTSVLPKQLLSNPDGTFTEHNRKFGKISNPAQSSDMGLVDWKDTGGWLAWTQDSQDGDNGIAIVFGKDADWNASAPGDHWKAAHVKWGYTDAIRDYNVGVAIMPMDVQPGESFYFRGFMVIGDIQHMQSKANDLVNKVAYGKLAIGENESGLIPYNVTSSNGQSILAYDDDQSLLQAYAYPVHGSKPLYLMRNTNNGKLFVSNDPYEQTQVTSYSNPYQLHYQTLWDDLNGWTIVNGGPGQVDIWNGGQLRLYSQSGTASSLSRNDLSIPEEASIRFQAKIDRFSTSGNEALGMKVNNGLSLLELNFNNGQLKARNANLGWTNLGNIDSDWHDYEVILQESPGQVKVYQDGVLRGAYTPPSDVSPQAIALSVRGTATSASESYLDNLFIGDWGYHTYNNRSQYRPYDGSTQYLGLLGYVIQDGSQNTGYNYTNLSTVLTDSSYYPNPAGIVLKARQ